MTDYATLPASELPALTVDQMREVDRLMAGKYAISLVQMMENAGRALATLARELYLGKFLQQKTVVILAGSGGNGGGGLVCARRLVCWGAQVLVLLTKDPSKYEGVPLQQLKSLENLNIRLGRFTREVMDATEPDLIIDAIIGYSLRDNLQGVAAEMTKATNEKVETSILSLDTPSGFDPNGVLHNPHIQANATLTLALPKVGLVDPTFASVVGDLYLADISVPPVLYTEPSLGFEVPTLFSEGDIARILVS